MIFVNYKTGFQFVEKIDNKCIELRSIDNWDVVCGSYLKDIDGNYMFLYSKGEEIFLEYNEFLYSLNKYVILSMYTNLSKEMRQKIQTKRGSAAQKIGKGDQFDRNQGVSIRYVRRYFDCFCLRNAPNVQKTGAGVFYVIHLRHVVLCCSADLHFSYPGLRRDLQRGEQFKLFGNRRYVCVLCDRQLRHV